MLYTFIFILAFMLMILLDKGRNKYHLLICLMFLCLAGACVSMMLYVNKLSDFKTTFYIDRQLYLFLQSIHMNFYDIVRMFDMFNIMFLYVMGMFAVVVKNKPTKILLLQSGIMLLPSIIYIVINDPEWLYRLFLIGTKNRSRQEILVTIHLIYNNGILLLYTGIPILVLVRDLFSHRLWIVKQNTLMLIMALLSVDIFYMGFFAINQFGNIVSPDMDYLRFNINYRDHITYFTYIMPLISVAVLVFLFVLIFKFKILYLFDEQRTISIRKRLTKINDEFYGVLHSQKNMFFVISILARDGLEEATGREKEIFDKIQYNANIASDNLARLLESLNRKKPKREKCDIVDCLYSAINSCPSEDVNIKVNIEGSREIYKLYIDNIMFTEGFRNLLMNSLDAIKSKGEKNGRIEINVFPDAEWVGITITDNGCGISKKYIKRVFNPLVSTKNNKNNWGVGLSYVKSVFKVHSGYVRIKSRENEYTSVEMAIPKAYVKRGRK